MVLPNNTLYAPYGAYELKACYQRHLLLAIALTSFGVLLALMVSWGVSLLLSATQVPPVVILRDIPPVIIISDLPPQPSIDRPPPDIRIDQPKPAPDRGGVMVPVADTQLVDDGGLLPTREETRDQIGPGNSGDDKYDSSWSFDSSSGLEQDPEPDSFIVCEIQPEMIYEVQPEFPRLAQQMGLGGTVYIKALVGKDGAVRTAMVYGSSGNELLDEAALKVASLNRFRPGIQSNRPVAVWVVYKVVFSLE
jgi:protein TonB